MFKAALKVCVLFFMLVSFVGQAMADNTFFPCEASSDAHVASALTSPVNHDSSISISAEHSEGCCDINDCCDTERCAVNCICITSVCSFFTYFDTELSSTKIAILSEAVYKQPSEQPNTIASLLYRPPILSS